MAAFCDAECLIEDLLLQPILNPRAIQQPFAHRRLDIALAGINLKFFQNGGREFEAVGDAIALHILCGELCHDAAGVQHNS